ncbi:MAG: hypothetical protein ACO1SX_01960 [Actinomycetota bacterium]
MRWPVIAGAIIALGATGMVKAEDGPYRRFTRPQIDTNRNNRMVYVPVASAFPGSRPAEMPYDVASAAWYARPLGSRDVKPDKVLDGDTYQLERFDTARNGDSTVFEVVITRSPAPPADWDIPLLRVVEGRSNISSAATPTTTPIDGGVRYRFLVRPPLEGFAPTPNGVNRSEAVRYQLAFLPAREVKEPPALRRAATFDGASVETRMQQGPPQLTVAERVAGKRLEFRSSRSAGRVVNDQKVAGKRQELRNR